MLPYLTFFNFTLFVLLVPLLLFIVFFILIPVIRLKSHQKEGTITYFYPIVGNMKAWFENADKYGDIVADLKRISPLYSDHTKLSITNFNSRLFFWLIDPQYVKAFVQNPNYYVKSPIIDWTRIMMKNGLLIIEDDAWKRHRKIISASFHYEFLKPHVAVIQNTTQEFLNKIPPSEFTNFEVLSKIKEITGEMVGRIFFGEHLNDYTFEGRPLTIALAEITAEAGMTSWDPLVVLFGIKILNLPIPKYKRMLFRMREFRKLCFKIVGDRKSKSQQSNDLLAALLATQTSEDVENRFSDEEIIDEFLMFFIAGMDTTAQMIGMTLYMLTQNPQYLKDLKDERETVYNRSSKVTVEEIQKMEVLHSVIKESLRFYTPGPVLFARIAKVDHKILDLQIRKGDLVAPEILTSAFNSNNFKNPQEFSPERWRTAEISKLDPYAFIPFSAGPRNCVGQHLAMIEAKIIISEFLNKFEFKMKEGYQLKMTFKFVYEPEKPFYFELSPVKNE